MEGQGGKVEGTLTLSYCMYPPIPIIYTIPKKKLSGSVCKGDQSVYVMESKPLSSQFLILMDLLFSSDWQHSFIY